MIKRLRKKFIAVSMLSVFIVLAVMIGAINIMNYAVVVREADQTLRIISDNGGTMPRPGRIQENVHKEGKEKSSDNGIEEGKPADLSENGSRGFGRHSEMLFDTRYFTVSFNESGEIERADTENIAAISDDDARDIATKIYSSGSEKGFSGDYRYLRTGDTMIICVDCYRSLSNFRSFLLLSVLVSLAGLMAVLMLVILLSGKAVAPIAESYDKQKQFITDAGHELKTPLTVIDADVTVLEMENGGNEWLTDIKAQTKRLAGLTNELVYLSRMDEGKKPEKLLFPLSDVAEDEASSFMARAKLEGKMLDIDVAEGISYEGDEKMIRELISILMDNAIKYSDDGGSIRIKVRPDGKGALIVVENTVDTIDREQTSHMFDRFYRSDASRSEKSGYGLGLSIAKAVCESHGGSIAADPAPDGKSVTISAKLS